MSTEPERWTTWADCLRYMNQSDRRRLIGLAKPDDGPPRDDRFEWIDVSTTSGTEPRWIKGRCHHKHVDPVATVTGELVRWLCTDCGTEWDPDEVPWPVPADMWRPVPPAPVRAAPEPRAPDVEILAGGHVLHRGRPAVHRDNRLVSCLREMWHGFKSVWPVCTLILWFALGHVITRYLGW